MSGEFFEVLGVRPALGRLIGPADNRPGCAAAPIVVSHRFWQRQLSGDPAAIGRPLTIDGVPMEIVGVAARGFDGLEVGRSFDVAVPICAERVLAGERSRLDRGDYWWLSVMGRLPAGVTAEQAGQRLAPLSTRVFTETLPARYTPVDAASYLAFTLTAVPAGSGVSELRNSYQQPLWLLLGLAGAVLVIACGNLANLMLARASAREREIAVRLAIGASRARVFRQLLIESLVLSVTGTALGIGLAGVMSRGLVALLATPDTTYFVELSLGWRVIAFAAALAVVACGLFGLLPAVRATRAAPSSTMKSGARGSSDDRSRVLLRRGLVIGQVALSLVLVTTALLFVGTLRNLQTAESGFRSDGILVANLDLRGAGVPIERRLDFRQEFIRRVAALPAVQSVSGADIVPLSGSGWNNTIVIDGQPRKPYPNFNSVGARYFEAMQIPLVAGRLFDERDTLNAPRVVIVDEAFGQAFFQTPHPIGREFQIDVGPGEPSPVYRIVGVVKNTKYLDLREDFGPIGYFPDTQDASPRPFLSLVVRGRPGQAVAPAISGTMRAMHPRMLVTYRVLDDQIRGSLVRERLMATLSGFFGALAGLLAAIGLYGVLSYVVTRRRFEIGLRMALGADRMRVLRMILGESSVLVGIGLVIGVALALWATRWSASLLFGLRPTDARMLALAATGLVLVAALASLIPARRASLVSPTQALRND